MKTLTTLVLAGSLLLPAVPAAAAGPVTVGTPATVVAPGGGLTTTGFFDFVCSRIPNCR